MLKVVDVLLLPVECKHVLVGFADLQEALLVRASRAHFNLEAFLFV